MPNRTDQTRPSWSSRSRERPGSTTGFSGEVAAQIFFCKIAQGFLLKVDLVSIFWVRFVRF
jgi:hypothetical protein